MRAPKSPVERYMSERILSFAYLMCPSVCRPNELKNMSVICHIQFQWKVTEHFWNRIWSVHKKSLSLKKYFERKICRHVFVVYVLIYPLSKFGSNQTNSLWVLAFYRVRFKWKIGLEKTALNMSIRWLIFTFGQNLRPPFLCQYWIFFNDFFFCH